jgi:hypothetical protein
MAGKEANMLSSAMRSSMLPMWSLLMALEITGGALAAGAAVAPDGAAAKDGVCSCAIMSVEGRKRAKSAQPNATPLALTRCDDSDAEEITAFMKGASARSPLAAAAAPTSRAASTSFLYGRGDIEISAGVPVGCEHVQRGVAGALAPALLKLTSPNESEDASDERKELRQG